ncbi:MAG: hypothetical protein ACRC6A_08175 [Fusobacteriaceae bacterium]
MKKIIATLSLLTMGLTSFAGTVNGTMTKIRVYERDNYIKFESRIPNLTYRIRKVDVLKGMTRIGKTRTIGEVEKVGIEVKTEVVLDRIANGLFIRTKNNDMFVTEKELDNIR